MSNGIPNLADIDGDGKLEIIAASIVGDLFAWDTTIDADSGADWPVFQHDEGRTSNAE